MCHIATFTSQIHTLRFYCEESRLCVALNGNTTPRGFTAGRKYMDVFLCLILKIYIQTGFIYNL